MSQQSTTGFGVAHPVPYSTDGDRHPDSEDTSPSSIQPPGVDEEMDLEEALTSL